MLIETMADFERTPYYPIVDDYDPEPPDWFDPDPDWWSEHDEDMLDLETRFDLGQYDDEHVDA